MDQTEEQRKREHSIIAQQAVKAMVLVDNAVNRKQMLFQMKMVYSRSLVSDEHLDKRAQTQDEIKKRDQTN
jgi:hypothetical protein